MAWLVVNLLGTFQVTLDGRPVDAFEYDKARALLAYLAVESDRPHRREKLVGLLWPGYPEASARRNLAQALYILRNALGERSAAVPFLLVTPATIRFNRAAGAQLDVDQFQAAVAAGTLPDLEQAAALYRGRFLSGLSPDDCPVFDEWIALKREALHQQAVYALHLLAELHHAAGQLRPALRVAQRQVALDPYWEAGRRTLMRLLDANGQRNAALAQYESLQALLAADLRVEPEPQTTALYHQIRAAPPPGLAPRVQAALRSALLPAGRAGRARLAAGATLVALLGTPPRPTSSLPPRDPVARAADLAVDPLLLWPRIDLQPCQFNPLVKLWPAGSEDELVLNPMVVLLEGRHHALCTGVRDWPGGPAVIRYAKSPGGQALRFQVLSDDPRLVGDGAGFDARSVAMPVLIADGAGWQLYFAGDDAPPFGQGLAIGRATAADPAGPWTSDAAPVLLPGAPGEWDACSVAPGSVVRAGPEWRLYYLGSSHEDCSRWAVGLATSRDGVRWTKHDDRATRDAPYAAGDPVLVPGEPSGWDGYALPSVVVRDAGVGWELFYTGQGADGRRAVGYAWSADGVDWHKHPGNPILKPQDDPNATDALQVHSVIVDGTTYEIYYDYGLTNELGRALGTVRWPIVVDTTDDELNADGDCSLREAIEAANRDAPVDVCPAGCGHDWVVVPAGTYRLTLHGVGEDGNQAGDLDILYDLTLQGAGAELTIIDGDGADRVIHNHGVTLQVSDLTITNGWVPPDQLWGGGLHNQSGSVSVNRCIISRNVAPYGGGLCNWPAVAGAVARMEVNDTWVISNTVAGNGGGIMNLRPPGSVNSTAILTVTRSTLAGNLADGSLRPMGAGAGGGIASGITSGSAGAVARVTIRDSTVWGNVAGGRGRQMGSGGGIASSAGEVTLINSTVSGNRAAGEGFSSGLGGGVLVSAAPAPGSLTLVNSTVSGNTAAAGGGLVAVSMECFCGDVSDPQDFCFGLPLYPGEPVVILHNTIVAGNQAPVDAGCHACGSTPVSQGFNLEDGNTCRLDQSTDLTDTGALLSPLGDHGGPTWTHRPLPGSPVIDAGRCPGYALDQRGYPRPVDHPHVPNAADGCDIGAFELAAD